MEVIASRFALTLTRPTTIAPHAQAALRSLPSGNQAAWTPLSAGRSPGFASAVRPCVRGSGDGQTREGCRSVAAQAAAAGNGAAAVAVESPSDELRKKGDAYFLADSRPVILFDGVCNMCNGGVNFMLDNDSEGKVRFAALQSEAGKALLTRSGRSPDDISSIVLVCHDRSYIKSEAILRIAQQLSFPYPSAAFVAFLFPLFLRDTFYDTVANNRYSVFGMTNSCRLSDLRFAERFVE